MSAPLPIKLGIVRISGNAQSSSGQVSEALLQDTRKKIFERDDYTCHCCGFKALKYQDIHYYNGNPKDLRPENMQTLCMFCQQCFDLEGVSNMRSGVLIWLPEIAQEDLHHIARAVYVARISQGPMADAARRTLDVLMARRDEVRKRLGTDDPYILASVLKDYISNRVYDARDKKLDGVRLFPLDRRIIKEAELEFNQFPQILAYWRSKDGPFGQMLPRQWVDLYKQISHAA